MSFAERIRCTRASSWSTARSASACARGLCSRVQWRRAEWTLLAAYKAIEKYLFEVRPDRVHPVLGITPNEFEAKSRDQTGHREFRMFTLDESMRSANDTLSSMKAPC